MFSIWEPYLFILIYCNECHASLWLVNGTITPKKIFKDNNKRTFTQFYTEVNVTTMDTDASCRLIISSFLHLASMFPSFHLLCYVSVNAVITRLKIYIVSVLMCRGRSTYPPPSNSIQTLIAFGSVALFYTLLQPVSKLWTATEFYKVTVLPTVRGGLRERKHNLKLRQTLLLFSRLLIWHQNIYWNSFWRRNY